MVSDKQSLMRLLKYFTLASLAIAMAGCEPRNRSQDDRVVIRYWEKWTGFEGEAMRGVVDDFNASQDRIFVNYSTVSQIDRKFMLATAGGVPPDIAGVWSHTMPVYAENNALMPLDEMAAAAGIKREDYIDVIWKLCSHRGHLFALPSTPASNALVWNKKLFREAGLDPERPPRSIAELEQFNEQLLRRHPDGRLKAIGHLPLEPGWWNGLWGFWFGGELWDGEDTVTAASPENIKAYSWVRSYPERFGAQDLLTFRDGFGNFASPQNPFFTGRVAMILQGVFIYNFIKNYAPADFEWGVAPFPSADPERLKNICLVECDTLVIPAGAKHPKEAFEFLKYVNSRKPMEKLCLGQLKFTPFREYSPDFLKNHPNPYLKTFIELTNSPNAQFAPRLTTWTEYANDMNNAVGRIWIGKASAEEALRDVQQRQQLTLDRRLARWNRLKAKLLAEWREQ
jgi:multiple sugar transport system substrate-binding protein